MGNYFTDLAVTDALNAATLNDVLDQLDEMILALEGWAESEAYEATSVIRDSNGVVTTATVKWPDGSDGTFTTVTKNSTWLVVDAYTITHTNSGKTVTQAAVTRDSAGNITTKPALTVA